MRDRLRRMRLPWFAEGEGEDGRTTRRGGKFASGTRAYLLPEVPCCPWPSCWERPSGVDPHPALCYEHRGRLAPNGHGCAWPGCSGFPWEGGLCHYHDLLARGLIDCTAHDLDRQAALAHLPAR